MKQEFLAHKLAYLILGLGLALLLLVFLAVWPDRFLQQATALVMAGFYLAWGLVTHLHHQQLTKQVVYEYLGVSVLAALVLLFITW